MNHSLSKRIRTQNRHPPNIEESLSGRRVAITILAFPRQPRDDANSRQYQERLLQLILGSFPPPQRRLPFTLPADSQRSESLHSCHARDRKIVMHWRNIMRRISIHPLVLLDTSRCRSLERETARMRIADSGFDIAERKSILIHTAGSRFPLLASAKVQSESVVRRRESQVAERRVVRGGAGVDPDSSVFAGGEAVAVYACGLHEDFGAPEVAAVEVVGYGGGGGCCFGVLGRGGGVGEGLLGWDAGGAWCCCVSGKRMFSVGIL